MLQAITLPFNPIKVLFLLYYVTFHFLTLFRFQSYQGSIFTQGGTQGAGFWFNSFNPIKVLFLPESEIYVDSGYGKSFNPIKVLFLHSKSSGFSINKFNLSILSRFYFYMIYETNNSSGLVIFQSYQGSIFTWDLRDCWLGMFAFNPIKVLFLLEIACLSPEPVFPLSILSRFYFYRVELRNIGMSFSFQSYQGSIFTRYCLIFFSAPPRLSILSRFYFYGMPWPSSSVLYTLSILSRFYFYKGRTHTLLHGTYLSILSRFYFYASNVLLCQEPDRFQSYQGSIFTLFFPDGERIVGNFQSYQGSIFTRCDPFWNQQSLLLSILSRFYFYNSWETLQFFVDLSFNPIKVLFLPYSPIVWK